MSFPQNGTARDATNVSGGFINDTLESTTHARYALPAPAATSR